MRVEYTVTADSLAEVKHIVDLIEGLEAKPEPVQSVVGAAGCGVKQGESGVGASWQIVAKCVRVVEKTILQKMKASRSSHMRREYRVLSKLITKRLNAIEAAAQEQDVL